MNTILEKMKARETIQGYRLADYDFLVVGNKTSDTIDFGKRRFAAKTGIGLDSNRTYAQEDRKKGFAVVEGGSELLSLFPSSFRFSILLRSLPHMASHDQVKVLLTEAARVSQDFLYIRYPSFDYINYLKSLGLRQFWTNWTGHKMMLRLDEVLQLFEEVGFRRYFIRRLGPITSSAHPSIIPLDTPKDQSNYDPAKHGPKREVKFEKNLWQETEFYIALRPMELDQWKAITG